MLSKKKQTIPSVNRDFPEWHRGRREYTLWMIELEQGAVLEKVHAARKRLSGFLHPSCQRQPHITLFVCGFLAEAPRHDDDYGREQLDDHCRLLKDSQINPFSIPRLGIPRFPPGEESASSRPAESCRRE